ncbi:MAG: hypothetical protein IJ324_01665 [Lachnospiraceae bacterium]|nr:hypothetical protein [Lachnospiraceae bacterium]
MDSMDTVNLLKECDAGIKMAVVSIDEILEYVCDEKMKQLLQGSKAQHKKLEGELSVLLRQHGESEKEPSPIAKGMSWMKTNMKMSMDNSDSMAAELITDGCNMGVKSLQKYLNEYQSADAQARAVCERLISIEEKLCKDLRAYL